MVFFRRIIKQLLFTALIGLVIRKLIASDNPRTKKIGQQANRYLGGAAGPDGSARHAPRRRRSVTRTAGSALVGGAMSYFFDPQQGAERRARAKTFASQKLRRNGRQPLLPPPERMTTPAQRTVTAKGA